MQQLKQRIAQQFSRAACQYDSEAHIQADIAFDAIAMLPQRAGLLLDIGCGTGRYAQQLISRSTQLVGVDIAQGMVDVAQQQHSQATWLCADAEALPLANHTVNTIFSSMAMQWCTSPLNAMQECSRVMQSGATGVLAIMCDGSFHELNDSWSAVEHQRQFNAFHSAEAWQQGAVHAGLNAQLGVRRYTSWHNNLNDLLNSFRKVGASTRTHSTYKLITRETLRSVERTYRQRFANQGQLPLTYQVALLKVSKPHV